MKYEIRSDSVSLLDDSGKLLAQVTYPEQTPGVYHIDHTFVDESLRGQGIAGKLMKALAGEIRKSGKKAKPTCPYAVNWFDKHKEYADIVAH